MNILLPLVFFATLAGSQPGVPVPPPAPPESSVKIVSTSPDVSVPLRVGDHVKLRIEVAYNLAADRGTLSVVVQGGDNSEVVQDTQVVTRGAGKITFETEFVVPKTKAVLVFAPLAAQGQSATSIVDMWAFKVITN